MTDDIDTPELDIIQDGKLSDEPVEAGKTPAEEVEDKAPADTEDKAASQDDDPGDDATEDDGDEPKKAKPKVQKRIDELTKARHDAERRADRLQAELERARVQPVLATTNAPDPGEYEQGEADPNYVSDLTVHKLEQRQAAARADSDKQNAEIRQKDAAKDWAARTAEAATRYDDYEAVAMNNSLPISDAMAEAITESDLGPDILYKLGQNPAEARRISSLSPVKQAIEIGRLETLVEGSEGVEPVPKRLTTAPAPGKRLAGKVTPQKDPSKMTYLEYVAFRAKKTA